jgi:hypothetical protein
MLSAAQSRIAGISGTFDRSPNGSPEMIAEGEGDIENAHINVNKPL